MASDNESSRREFLGALSAGVAAAGTLAATSEATAQGAAPLKIVDFHNHYMGPSWTLTNLANVPPAARPAWEKINGNLQSESALLASLEAAGVAARVINTPTAFIEDADGNAAVGRAPAHQRPDGGAVRQAFRQALRARDRRCVRRRCRRARADPGGEGAAPARRVRRKRQRAISCSATRRRGRRSTAAAALGVPVFVHPLTDPQLHKRFSRTGRIGLRLARGTINSAALINMLESGAFDEAPKLQLVVTTLAFGGAAARRRLRRRRAHPQRRAGAHPPSRLCRHHGHSIPSAVRAAVDLLGADHVLMGTDWPIVEEKSVPERLQKALAHSGLNAAEQQMVAGGNALRLLGVS